MVYFSFSFDLFSHKTLQLFYYLKQKTNVWYVGARSLAWLHSYCCLSLRDLCISASRTSYSSLLRLFFLTFRIDIRTRKYITASLGTARWADPSTRHHPRPRLTLPKGSGLMWWLVLRWARLTFSTMPYRPTSIISIYQVRRTIRTTRSYIQLA